MENDTIKLINNLYPYFKMLDNINKYLTKIINKKMHNNPYQDAEIFYNITSELLRLMPYKYNEKRDEIWLDKECGILLLPINLDFIVEKYNKIIFYAPFTKELKNIIKIRNKYMHEPHNVTYAFIVEGGTSCSVGFYYKNKLLSISSISLSAIAYYLNQIFEKIQYDILEKIGNDKKYKGNYIYKILCKFDFSSDKWHYTILPEYLMWGFNTHA